MSYSADEVAEFENVTCTQETAKAILCWFETKSAWVPKSQVHDDSEVWGDGDSGTLVVKLWFAEKEGLFE